MSHIDKSLFDGTGVLGGEKRRIKDQAQVAAHGYWLDNDRVFNDRKRSISVLLATASFSRTLVFPISGQRADILGI